MGWDISDPAVVTPEYAAGGGRADYALLGPDGKPAATVEAKKLGEPLAAHRMRMLNYSNASGVEYAGLTYGDHWELYEVFQRGQLEERRILNVSIAAAPAHHCGLQLLLLWRPNLASGQPVAANKPVVGMPLDQPSDILDPLGSAQVSPVSIGNWISLASFQPTGRQTPPTAIRFAPGEVRPVARWRDVLVEILEQLIQNGRFTPKDCPWSHGGLGIRVNTTPSGDNGRAFAAPKEVTGGIYVETTGNRWHIITRSRSLWDRFGGDPETVELRFE